MKNKEERKESQRIREEALASSREVRKQIGEETLQKINRTMQKMHQDPLAKARMSLNSQDKTHMHDVLRNMMADKD